MSEIQPRYISGGSYYSIFSTDWAWLDTGWLITGKSMSLGGSGYLINFIYTAHLFNRACMIQSVYLNYLIKRKKTSINF